MRTRKRNGSGSSGLLIIGGLVAGYFYLKNRRNVIARDPVPAGVANAGVGPGIAIVAGSRNAPISVWANDARIGNAPDFYEGE